MHTRFIELAGEVNSSMPEWVVSKVADGLNLHGKSVNGSRILILGIAYKKNIDDMRESPAALILELLRDKGAEISYSDPHVPKFPAMRKYDFDLSSVDLSAEMIREYDCVVLTTDHDLFDYDMIRDNASLIVDARGKYRDSTPGIIRA